jgi:hypothetical protein
MQGNRGLRGCIGLLVLEWLAIPLRKDRKHGRPIGNETDFVIPFTANHSYLDQLAFEPSPVCLRPNDDVVVWIYPSMSARPVNGL